MTPFQILGVPVNATVEEAKTAYRRLAQQHHPDKGGNEETFKSIKAAFETIEKGYREEPKQTSSFSPGFRASTPKTDFAGKPASGYEAKRTAPVLPHTYSTGGTKGVPREVFVTLEISEDRAFEGCNVPFWHDGNVYDFPVRPGSSTLTEIFTVPKNPMIGMNHHGMVSIRVSLVVTKKQSAPEEKTRDAVMDLPLCALGLFTGGSVSVTDHLGEKVTITIPAGHDFRIPIKIPKHGYGAIQRGALLVNLIPIFKHPGLLNPHEHIQLQRLNDMVQK